jgi:hypothetical protein
VACLFCLQLLLHGRASRASDVYAMGCLLYHVATGRRVFASERQHAGNIGLHLVLCCVLCCVLCMLCAPQQQT